MTRVLGVSACLVSLLAGCVSGGDEPDDPVEALPTGDFEATFEVEDPIDLVAGDGRAWVLTPDGSGAVLARIDHTGRSTEVDRLPGVSQTMAPYRDGVVATRVACDAEDCEETVAKIVVVDGTGSIVAEAEYARQAGGIQETQGVELIGVHGDVVWLKTRDGVVGHDLATGDTVATAPSPLGATCLLDGELHTPVPLDGQYFGHEGVVLSEDVPDPVYGFVISRLDDGVWTPLPDTLHELTDLQFTMAECLAGGMLFGRSDLPAPAWSPVSGWVERGPVLAPPTWEAPPELTARGQADQLFVLQSAGQIRRWSGSPDGPLSSETIDVPADVFAPSTGAVPVLLFDRSPTVIAGCLQPTYVEPPAQCYVRSA